MAPLLACLTPALYLLMKMGTDRAPLEKMLPVITSYIPLSPKPLGTNKLQRMFEHIRNFAHKFLGIQTLSSHFWEKQTESNSENTQEYVPREEQEKTLENKN